MLEVEPPVLAGAPQVGVVVVADGANVVAVHVHPRLCNLSFRAARCGQHEMGQTKGNGNRYRIIPTH